MTGKTNRYAAAFLLTALFALTAAAQSAHIRISGEASGKNSIARAGIRSDGTVNASTFIGVLKSDLSRSGYFNVVEGTSGSVSVSGSVSGQGGISVSVEIRRINGSGFRWSKSGANDDVRDLAHELSDAIVYNITGKPGMASAPVLLVGKRGGGSDIYVCDADGARLRAITSDGATSMSPTWLPDRTGFLYTSFKSGMSEICKVSFGPPIRRTKFADYAGLNNGGVVSPDGIRAAMVLSLTGNVELFVKNINSGKLTRLTRTKRANESSPDWSPDGSQIVYVSDASGAPHIWIMDQQSKQGKRLVYGPSESVAPDWGPDGRIAFCGRESGRYVISVVTPGSSIRPVQISPTDGADYEDPSWAPDARHIVATRTFGGKRKLVVLDTQGDAPVDLFISSVPGDWYLSDWAK